MGTHYRGSPEEVQALESYIKLQRAADSFSGRVNLHLRDVNLTASQFGVLEALYHLGPLQIGQLAEKILKSSGNLTTVIDNLARRALVERQRRDDDRRCIDIHITESGRRLIEQVFPRHVAIIVEEMDILTTEEQETLARLCRKLGLGQTENQKLNQLR